MSVGAGTVGVFPVASLDVLVTGTYVPKGRVDVKLVKDSNWVKVKKP